jgi:hypothetical protein
MSLSTVFRRLLGLALVAAIVLLATRSHAQTAPAWNQLRLLPASTGFSDAHTVALGADGSQYVAGRFFGTFTLGNGVTVTAGPGLAHLFLVKYSAARVALWATALDAATPDVDCQLAVDAAGNAYLAGHFIDALSVGTTTLTTSTSAASNAYDTFLVKYDAQGVLQWSRQGMAGRAGTAGTATLGDVAIDASGNVVIVGNCITAIAFGGPSLAGTGIFYYRFSPAGVLLQGQVLSGSNAYVEALAFDGAGQAFLTGGFTGTAALGGVSLTAAGGLDAFLCKLSPTGTVLWAQAAGGPGQDYGTAVAADAAGNALVGGYYGATPNTPNAFGNLYVARFTPQGVRMSDQQTAVVNGIGYEHTISSVAFDGRGGYYVAGSLRGTATFGSSTVSTANHCVFVVRYTNQNTPVWVSQTTNATPSDLATLARLVIDASGRAVLVGIASGNVQFGSFAANASLAQAFVAELSAGGLLTASRPAAAGLALQAYPNPASGTATLALPVGGGQLDVLDALGRTVRRQALPATAGPCAVPLAGLAPGHYQLRAMLGNGQPAHATLQVE